MLWLVGKACDVEIPDFRSQSQTRPATKRGITKARHVAYVAHQSAITSNTSLLQCL